MKKIIRTSAGFMLSLMLALQSTAAFANIAVDDSDQGITNPPTDDSGDMQTPNPNPDPNGEQNDGNDAVGDQDGDNLGDPSDEDSSEDEDQGTDSSDGTIDDGTTNDEEQIDDDSDQGDEEDDDTIVDEDSNTDEQNGNSTSTPEDNTEAISDDNGGDDANNETSTSTDETSDDASGNAGNASSTNQLVSVKLRYNDLLAFEGTVAHVTGTTTVYDNAGVGHDVPADSALAVLMQADQDSESFAVSDLAYYASFNSFLINCINLDIVGSSTSACYNWQYVHNGSYPYVGANAETVAPGDTVFFYFGQPKRVTFEFGETATTSDTTFRVLAQTYNYEDDTWLPLSGKVIGATMTDPDNPWSPIEVATSTSDEDGFANFALHATGTYYFGYQEDYYYPTEQFDIVAAEASTSTLVEDEDELNDEEDDDLPGTGGTPVPVVHTSPDIEAMLAFLDSVQQPDGSFGADLYTDWAAIAYGSASGHATAKSKLREYLKSDTLGSDAVTDHERRAMALMALGVDPRSGGADNHIKPIKDEFDGDQIGDPEYYNDDIFGIIALRNAGYTDSDEIIKKAAQFVASRQSVDGSWDGVDMTAAAMQAITLSDVAGKTDILVRATNYLKAVQQANGGFGNSFSTSWAVMGLSSNGIAATSVLMGDKNPFDYLASLQQLDGRIEPETVTLDNQIWTTSYAIAAVTGRTWADILADFPKPVPATVSPQSDSSSTYLENRDSSAVPPLVLSSTSPGLPALEPLIELTVRDNSYLSVNEYYQDPREIALASQSADTESAIPSTDDVEASAGVQDMSQTAGASSSRIPLPVAAGFAGLALIMIGGYFMVKPTTKV